MSSESLWAVTAYFNPQGYETRLANFRLFRDDLKVPLVVAEASTSDSFDLADEDADVVLRIRATDVMWHKERLLTLAIDAVPGIVDRIAWLDCDMIFERDDWSAQAHALLDDFPLVQLYAELVRQPEGCLPGTPRFPAREPVRPSFASLPDCRQDPARVLREQPRRPGMAFPGPVGGAWAGRRSLLEEVGLYGAGILGGGDTAAMSAVCGAWDVAFRHLHMTPAARERFMVWAEPFHQRVGGRLGCVDGQVYHLWHGNEVQRDYGNRYERLASFAFDPTTDIALGANGLYEWSTDKPAMHAFVRDYFAERREDG